MNKKSNSSILNLAKEITKIVISFCVIKKGTYMKLKDYINEEKPREKLKSNGVKNLSDSEILSILLRTGTKKESVNELSTRLLKEAGSLKVLCEMSYNRLCEIEGIKSSKASTILAAVELSKRAQKEYNSKIKFNNSLDIFNYYRNDFIGEKQEHFYILLFDTKMNLIKKEEIFRGTVDNVNVHPREVFNIAIKESASFIIVMHNHPSGDTAPSKEDIEMTNTLIKTANIIGIKLLDHIIISNEGYYSFYSEEKKDF